MSNHAFSSKVYNRQKFTIPKNSVYQIQFNGNNPNYYRVNNLGETVLYFATNNTPREDLYDFKCSPNSVANFAEPYTRDFLYCYNPNNVDVDILITYWEGEFDPAFIAFGESTLSVEGTVKTDGVINAFNAPLPSGNNVIGIVGLSDTATQRIIDIYNKTSNISTSTNTIKTNTETIKTDLSDINTNTGELLGIKTDTEKLGGIGTNLSMVLASTNTTRGYVDEIRSKIDTANEYLLGLYNKSVGRVLHTETYTESAGSIMSGLGYAKQFQIDTDIVNYTDNLEYNFTNRGTLSRPLNLIVGMGDNEASFDLLKFPNGMVYIPKEVGLGNVRLSLDTGTSTIVLDFDIELKFRSTRL